ncbi:SDR family oxidoreductase [Streptomyces sp. FXJ1.4098]|nr:SDR family oxidoreductase [Streptomyces sp. FXJ1.4098]
MSVQLRDAVAVVSGGGSGIGRATAHSLARRGARVVVTDRDGDRADTVAGELGERGIAAVCDVTRLEDLQAVRDLALERFGRVDIVMNNVGILAVGPVQDIPLDAWQRVIDVNLLGIVRSNLVFLPVLVEQGAGHVVNTASTAGLLPYGYEQMPYTATKHAVVGLSEALALYLRPRGIGVSCLCPGSWPRTSWSRSPSTARPRRRADRTPRCSTPARSANSSPTASPTTASSFSRCRKSPTNCANAGPTWTPICRV